MADPKASRAPRHEDDDRWLYLDMYLPLSLLDAAGAAAARNGKTLSAYINDTLAGFLEQNGATPPAALTTALTKERASGSDNGAPPRDGERDALVRRVATLSEPVGTALVERAAAWTLSPNELLTFILATQG